MQRKSSFCSSQEMLSNIVQNINLTTKVRWWGKMQDDHKSCLLLRQNKAFMTYKGLHHIGIKSCHPRYARCGQVGQSGVTSNYLNIGHHIAGGTREEPISKQPTQPSWEIPKDQNRKGIEGTHLIRRSKSLPTWANWARARRWGFAQKLLTSMRSLTSAGNNDHWPQ